MPRRAVAVRSAVLLAASLAALSARADPQAGASVQLEPGAGGARPALPNEACLVDALGHQPGASGYDGKVEVLLEKDGKLTGLNLLTQATSAAEQAVKAAFASCAWPAALAREGRGLVVLVMPSIRARGRDTPLSAAPSPGPPPPPVSFDGRSLQLGTERAAGFRRPVPADDGCLYQALRGKRKLAGLDNKVKFAVLRDGTVSHLTFLEPVDPEVEKLVAEAFASCRWTPAFDPAGTPLAVWVVQPLKIAPMLLPGERP
jgi:hypothetical protein